MSSSGFKKRVGVLRGGPSPEYEVSLKTGKKILSLDIPGYEWRDIFIDKHGVWHLDGLAKKPFSVLSGVDGVFNALHGTYGEDGYVQELLDTYQIPYTGSGRVASALAMRKDLALNCCVEQGIQIPASLLVREGDSREDVVSFYGKFSPPLIVKPVSAGSSVGIFLVSSEEELNGAIDEAFKFSSAVLVQEFIEGREATCGVIERFRGESVYPLFSVEIVPHFSNFFDYEEKYGGKTFERCPGNFSKEENLEIQRIAKLMHSSLGLRHYSRSDFVVCPERGVFFLEVNSLPGLTETSLFPLELDASGIKFEEFVKNVLDGIFN